MSMDTTWEKMVRNLKPVEGILVFDSNRIKNSTELDEISKRLFESGFSFVPLQITDCLTPTLEVLATENSGYLVGKSAIFGFLDGDTSLLTDMPPYPIDNF